MAYDLDSLHSVKVAESEAFHRLIEAPLEEWEEALGHWIRAIRALQRENRASRE